MPRLQTNRARRAQSPMPFRGGVSRQGEGRLRDSRPSPISRLIAECRREFGLLHIFGECIAVGLMLLFFVALWVVA